MCHPNPRSSRSRRAALTLPVVPCPPPAGLANPAPIITTFYADPQLPSRYKLDGVVTVVDAKNVT
jgi:hypothetical protein